MKKQIGKKQIGKNRQMKLCALVWVLPFAAAAFLFPQQSAASGPLELLEATGIFEGIDDTETPNVITLSVDGEKASGQLHESCVFYDERQRILPRKGFLQLYIRKTVTVEILEETGQVISCRGGS